MEEAGGGGGGGAAAASLKRLAVAVDGFVAQLQCAICLCAYANPSSLPCNHCFCEECIHRALELKPVCPICKAPAKKRKLRYDSMIQQLLHATEMLNAPVEKAVVTMDEGKTKKQSGDEQEMKTDDAALLLEEKPMPSIRISSSAVDGTSTEPNGVPESAATHSVKSKQNGHRGHIDSKSAEAAEPAAKRQAEAKHVADAATNGNKSAKQDESEEKKGDKRLLIDEVQPESNLSASNDDHSEQAKSEKSTRPATRRRQEEWALISTLLSPRRRAVNAVATVGEKSPQEAKILETESASASATETTAASPPEALSKQYTLNGPFAKGEVVNVVDRMWRGVNKLGGAARITKVNGNDTYNVKYVLDNRVENNILDYFIKKPNDELTADVTPSRAVKQRQRRTTKYDNTPSSEEKSATSPSAGSARGKVSGRGKGSGKRKRSEMVFLCSGYDEKGTKEIEKWSEVLDAEIVGSWTNQVTHLIVKCVVEEKASGGGKEEEDGSTDKPGTSGKRELFSDAKRPVKRWVKIRSMKYLKALVGGRWIVSEEWLRACAGHGGHVSEADFEADGHLKGQNIYDAVRRSRKRRQENLQLNPANVDPALVGTKLFEGFCFHLVGDFLQPMPPQSELDTLLSIGGGKRILSLSDIAKEMAKKENKHRQLVIVSDRINPVGLRDAAKQLRSLPQVKALSSVAIVSYQWVLNSISEANLRPLK